MSIALAPYGTGAPPVAVAGRASIGSARDCDLVVPGAASAHAIAEPVDGALRVTAIGSNPLHGGAWTPAVREVLVRPGMVAWVGGVPLLALDERLMALRARLVRSLGLGAHAAVDDALVAAATREPLLVLGPRGLDDEALIAALDGNVVCIDLDVPRALPAPHAARVFQPRRDARLVLRSTRPREARNVLDTYAERVRVVRLVPLAARPADVAPILAAIWKDEIGTPARVEALGAHALRGIASYRWPEQIDELRAHAPRILAYHQRGGLRAAARHLGIRHQTLGSHFRRIGFPVGGDDRDSDPLTAEYLILVIWRAKPGTGPDGAPTRAPVRLALRARWCFAARVLVLRAGVVARANCARGSCAGRSRPRGGDDLRAVRGLRTRRA